MALIPDPFRRNEKTRLRRLVPDLHLEKTRYLIFMSLANGSHCNTFAALR
jgi:hypothetical protein